MFHVDSTSGFGNSGAKAERRWFAVATLPRHEKSAVQQLSLRRIDAFLPTYETVRLWKNRQRMKIVLPLFPTYLFVRIDQRERVRVLESPGVLQIVGSKQRAMPLADAEVEFLRSRRTQQVEPYETLVVGERVRIREGAMQGIEGTLVRKNNRLRFVLTVELINQHAAIEVDAGDLEPAEA
jgi:transcription antitermination factor NusG